MYRLIRFGTTSLEHANQVDAIGSGPTPYGYQGLPDGGAIDIYGSVQKRPGAVERSKSLRLTASSQEDLSDLYFELLALVGKRDKLYRRLANNSTHWQYARLAEMIAERSYQEARFKLIQDVTLKFVSGAPVWNGASSSAWNLDEGYYLDYGLYLDRESIYDLTSNPQELTITVGNSSDAGRAWVTAFVITITAGDADLENVYLVNTVTVDGAERIYGFMLMEDIPAGKTAIIDTGLMQASLDGADAYEALYVLLEHWFVLLPGANSVEVGTSSDNFGNGSTIEIVYYEAWY